MELTNKRVQLTVRETGNTYSLGGEVTLDETKRITSFSGSFQNVDNVYVGYFNYSEDSDGKVNKNVYNINAEDQAACCDFLDDCIVTLKAQEI